MLRDSKDIQFDINRLAKQKLSEQEIPNNLNPKTCFCEQTVMIDENTGLLETRIIRKNWIESEKKLVLQILNGDELIHEDCVNEGVGSNLNPYWISTT